jgi:molybdate-binding protein/DNA-binding XRE family transcriptional regulator
MSPILNTLHSERLARGWTQERTARAAGITRQSYAAIEAATSVPSTEVALRLAHAFGRTVESLFRLPDLPRPTVTARWAGKATMAGQPVRLYRVSGDLLAHAVGEGDIVSRPADGTVVRRTDGSVEVALLPGRPPEPALAVAGCDPAIGLVSAALLQGWGVEVTWLPRGSRAALSALAAGEAHVAGAHLRDPLTGEFNEAAVRELVPFPCTRVGFAWWDQGLLVAPGNPLGVTDVSSLPRPQLRFLNREPGSGSRTLIDDRLAEAGISSATVPGYGTHARGHMAVAQAIAAGLADVGVGIRAAAHAYGLDHLRLDTERYDLVVPNHFLDLPVIGSLLDLLRGPGVRAQVEALGGYDASVMGE